METLAITHHRHGDRTRVLVVNQFETAAARTRRRRSRPARASWSGAVVIGCSTASDVQWQASVSDRGISVRRPEPAGDVCRHPAIVHAEDLA
ncbi:hypothetical protein [Opitutus terrae]|uniref:Uncharacterized protein n=1 Tax=Opitutus terrae (strain DSM 11246 / JCM 15787 / PB90-1) TaxID=452637 RepID=B1ZU15_OPITP|nr:hypothetical protein [Opitutus terrae]ACB75897.1 hypothetical protein Oter_2616 [Opitutus terrae PB90-1]